MAQDDLLKLVNKLFPVPGGEHNLQLRTGIVEAKNANGTIDASISGVLIEDVYTLADAYAATTVDRQAVFLQSLNLLLCLGTLPVTGTAGGNDGAAVAVDVFTGNDTWNKRAGAVSVMVELVGGGGSGGGTEATTASGTFAAAAAGGGGGGYGRKLFSASALGSSVSVTVGAGGAAPTAGANNGNTGGTSTFSTASATGGGGGQASTARTIPVDVLVGTGGDGGTATGCDFAATGQVGFNGIIIGTEFRTAGQGGASGFGFGGSVRASSAGAGNTGTTGALYGGGGSGANAGDGQAARSGGAGAPGIVIVTTFF